jgi:precorrin-6B methylase 2
MNTPGVILFAFGVYMFISATWFIAGIFGAPWVPTPIWVVDRMLKMADLKAGETLVDLGAGDGRIVIWAALRYKANAIGVEIDPLRCLWANFLIRLLGLRRLAKVHYASIYATELLPHADVVTAYLLQSTNQRLENKLTQECKPSARIISRTFTFPKFRLASQDHKRSIFLYKN